MTTFPTALDKPDLAPHLVPLVKGEWALWRLAGLRGAGFPAAEVLKLASPRCAEASDQYIKAEDAVRLAMEEVRASVNQALDALRQQGQWDVKPRRNQLLDCLHELKADRVPEAADDSSAVLLTRYREVRARLDECGASLQQAFKAAMCEMSQTIHESASSRSLQEAILWQNHSMWQQAIRPLQLWTSEGVARTSKRRQQEEVLASYLQRYCVKNDTIGFFGPVGWARFVSAKDPFLLRPGPTLVATREVYFEGWCIDTLAATLAKDKSLRPWLAPRCVPFVHTDQGRMYLPGGTSIKLQPLQTALLEACDGQRSAKLIAADLLRAGTLLFTNENDIYKALEALCNWGVVIWTLEIPLQRRPEETLRQLIQSFGEARHRQAGLGALEELEAGRDRIAAASGDPERLDRALTDLDEKFCSLTGMAAARSGGKTYAARTLVYQDCRRDVELEIGTDVLNALAPGLSLVLTSVRWMTYELAQMYRRAFRTIYERLVARNRSKTVSAADFWIQCDPIFYDENKRIADRIIPVLQDKWAEVLSIPPGARQVNLAYEEVRPRVEAAFPASGPGWPSARYNSPDIMIAAAGLEAIGRGDFQFVLGETHIGANCLNGSLFLGQHPQPDEIHQAVTADRAQADILPVAPKTWPKLTARTNIGFVPPSTFRLLVSADTCGIAPRQAVPIASLVVEDCDGELVFHTRDNRLRFEVLEVTGALLAGIITHSFGILPSLRHTPRVTVDRLTLTRESWRFFPSEAAFAFEKDELQRFLGARRWSHELGLPRFIFFKSPAEPKPFYIDFDSPILINVLAKMIRNAKEHVQPEPLMTVTEMFPAHEQLWLLDAAGNYYTSELRMITLDLRS